METWERIEERLKFIEKRIEEIRKDLEEMKPKEWDEEENDYGYYYDGD
jgi:septation ring formation regulator EzrA|tara:strand:- start:349 stop:492 length:144 start_codon:yes stop_codon:yes gene_type:complete